MCETKTSMQSIKLITLVKIPIDLAWQPSPLNIWLPPKRRVSKNKQVSLQSKYLYLGSSIQQRNNWARYLSISIAYWQYHNVSLYPLFSSQIPIQSKATATTKKTTARTTISTDKKKHTGIKCSWYIGWCIFAS